ncbi:MAG TPA: hypothetical protein VN445_07100 [Rectinemataceae bacterium]|nr:hypothetical protein [Rectinemataceae bacterium]
MAIFAIALVPEGNIIRSIREVSSSVFRSGDSLEALALPEGIFLGFYVENDQKGRGSLARSFKKQAQSLFADLPPLIRFSFAANVEGKWYIVPETPIPAKILAVADAIAEESGLLPMESPPLARGSGFFAGNIVTPPPFGAFSFRHLDALLYRIESDSRDFDRAWWTVLSRVTRHTGIASLGASRH